MDNNMEDRIKRDVLNELKPLMEECVKGWLDNQRDTLLLGLVGMIEQEKWKKEHNETDDAVANAFEELTNACDVFPELRRERAEEVVCEGEGQGESESKDCDSGAGAE